MDYVRSGSDLLDMSDLLDFKYWTQMVASKVRQAEGSSAIEFYEFTRPHDAALNFRSDGFSGGEWKSPIGRVLLSDLAGPAIASLSFYSTALKDDLPTEHEAREPYHFAVDGDGAEQAAKQIMAWLGDKPAPA